MNEKRIMLKVTSWTNRILKCYGTAEGYDLDYVYIKPLYDALLEFYTKHENAVGHTITHDSGILYIDGVKIVRFATKGDTINKRIGRCYEESYRAEGRILARQEEYMD